MSGLWETVQLESRFGETAVSALRRAEKSGKEGTVFAVWKTERKEFTGRLKT